METKIEVSGGTALAQFGGMLQEWERKPVDGPTSGFEVAIFVEGYRPSKDVWPHEVRRFDTLAEALTFAHEIEMKSWDEFAQYVEADYKGTGWYSISFEYATITETDAHGHKFTWERVRK